MTVKETVARLYFSSGTILYIRVLINHIVRYSNKTLCKLDFFYARIEKRIIINVLLYCKILKMEAKV